MFFQWHYRHQEIFFAIVEIVESGAILGNLFLNGKELPSGDKKLVSLD